MHTNDIHTTHEIWSGFNKNIRKSLLFSLAYMKLEQKPQHKKKFNCFFFLNRTKEWETRQICKILNSVGETKTKTKSKPKSFVVGKAKWHRTQQQHCKFKRRKKTTARFSSHKIFFFFKLITFVYSCVLYVCQSRWNAL